MPEARPSLEVTDQGQIAFGGGIHYDGEQKVRGEDLHDLIQAFLPSGLESLGLPSGVNKEERKEEFFQDPIRHLFVISSIVRQHLSYKKSWDLPNKLNGGVTTAKDIWYSKYLHSDAPSPIPEKVSCPSGEGNCQAFSIVFASILKHFGVHSRMMSLTSPTLRDDGTPKHPPHMVLMIHFPEEGFPSKDDHRYSERCSMLYREGLGELEEYAQTHGYNSKEYVGSGPFKKKAQLKWTHVGAKSKAALRRSALPGHYLLHPPQQMVGGYFGLETAGYLQKGEVCRFALKAIVRWSDAKQSSEESKLTRASSTSSLRTESGLEVSNDAERDFSEALGDVVFSDNDFSGAGQGLDPTPPPTTRGRRRLSWRGWPLAGLDAGAARLSWRRRLSWPL